MARGQGESFPKPQQHPCQLVLGGQSSQWIPEAGVKCIGFRGAEVHDGKVRLEALGRPQNEVRPIIPV